VGKGTVLVVDDEPDVVKLFEITLQQGGYEVIPAYDGISALDIAEADKPDLILLDIMMPMMSGYEVCQQLKGNPQTQNIPVVFITSAHNEMTRDSAKQAGAQALLVKPILPEELVAQVGRYMNSSEAD
jgi:CheY-like chemotaxis protein